MKEAIQKAIEGGWKLEDGTPVTNVGHVVANWQLYFYSPLFWRALGKAEGWSEKGLVGIRYQNNGLVLGLGENHVDWWQYEMHRFIDHLAEGKDAESFFKQILK